MNMKVHRWKTITALAAAASLALAIGAAPSQAATPAEITKVSAGLSASDLSKLPLTNRHLTKREKENLAVVLRAYHDGEGDSLDPQGFRDLFAADGVLNGIGGVEGQTSLRGTQLSGLIVFLSQFLPDIHRELKQITVSGDVVSIELSIQGTFLGPFQTPAGVIQPTGAKIDFPTADFWYLRNGKIETFDCHIAFTTLFRSWAYCRTTRPPSRRPRRAVTSASFQLLRRSPPGARGQAGARNRRSGP
jgi:hypothetical protein